MVDVEVTQKQIEALRVWFKQNGIDAAGAIGLMGMMLSLMLREEGVPEFVGALRRNVRRFAEARREDAARGRH